MFVFFSTTLNSESTNNFLIDMTVIIEDEQEAYLEEVRDSLVTFGELIGDNTCYVLFDFEIKKMLEDKYNYFNI